MGRNCWRGIVEPISTYTRAQRPVAHRSMHFRTHTPLQATNRPFPALNGVVLMPRVSLDRAVFATRGALSLSGTTAVLRRQPFSLRRDVQLGKAMPDLSNHCAVLAFFCPASQHCHGDRSAGQHPLRSLHSTWIAALIISALRPL